MQFGLLDWNSIKHFLKETFSLGFFLNIPEIFICDESSQVDNGHDTKKAWNSQEINFLWETKWQNCNNTSCTDCKVSIHVPCFAKWITHEWLKNSVKLIANHYQKCHCCSKTVNNNAKWGENSSTSSNTLTHHICKKSLKSYFELIDFFQHSKWK